MPTFIAALVCIVLAFVAAFTKTDELLFSPLLWLLASVAFSLLNPVLPGRKSE
jgi:hypothetical protein